MLSLQRPASQAEFSREFIIPNPLANHMRKVLHVGPCDTPGGMATVMHTLAESPPEGWQAKLIASHAPGGLWAKWRAYRRAKKELIRQCSSSEGRPDVVHVHTAADWSWRRKARLISIAQHHNIPTVVHFHSGQFHDWLEAGGKKRKICTYCPRKEKHRWSGFVKTLGRIAQSLTGGIEVCPKSGLSPDF